MPGLSARVRSLAAATASTAASSAAAVRSAPGLAAGSFAAGLAVGVLVSSDALEQFPTAADVPNHYVRRHRWLTGRVLSVTDGDTLRLRHTPFPLVPGRLPRGSKLSEGTIQVRLLAIDAPEVGKFGAKSQPFADDARAFVADRVLDKRVCATSLRLPSSPVVSLHLHWSPFISLRAYRYECAVLGATVTGASSATCATAGVRSSAGARCRAAFLHLPSPSMIFHHVPPCSVNLLPPSITFHHLPLLNRRELSYSLVERGLAVREPSVNLP